MSSSRTPWSPASHADALAAAWVPHLRRHRCCLLQPSPGFLPLMRTLHGMPMRHARPAGLDRKSEGLRLTITFDQKSAPPMPLLRILPLRDVTPVQPALHSMTFEMDPHNARYAPNPFPDPPPFTSVGSDPEQEAVAVVLSGQQRPLAPTSHRVTEIVREVLTLPCHPHRPSSRLPVDVSECSDPPRAPTPSHHTHEPSPAGTSGAVPSMPVTPCPPRDRTFQ